MKNNPHTPKKIMTRKNLGAWSFIFLRKKFISLVITSKMKNIKTERPIENMTSVVTILI
jgi:hypothetical protein